MRPCLSACVCVCARVSGPSFLRARVPAQWHGPACTSWSCQPPHWNSRRATGDEELARIWLRLARCVCVCVCVCVLQLNIFITGVLTPICIRPYQKTPFHPQRRVIPAKYPKPTWWTGFTVFQLCDIFKLQCPFKSYISHSIHTAIKKPLEKQFKRWTSFQLDHSTFGHQVSSPENNFKVNFVFCVRL